MTARFTEHINNVFVLLNPYGSFDVEERERGSVQRAVEIANSTHAALTLVAFTPESSLPRSLKALSKPEEGVEAKTQAIRDSVQALAERLRERHGLRVFECFEKAQPGGEDVIEWLKDRPVDMLVLERPSEQLGAATLALRYSALIRQTPFPVWFAGSPGDPSRGVVAAVEVGDLDMASELAQLDHRVLSAADSVGMLFDADVHVVQAYERRPAGFMGPLSAGVFPELNGAPANAVAESEEVGAELRAQELGHFACALGVGDAEVLAAPGNAADVLSASARALRAGLIVMGARSRSAWEALLAGGTAERTLAQAHCDVLFVKGEGLHAAQTVLARADDTGEATEVDIVVDPQRHFERPLAVLRSRKLSPRQKMMVLRGWREELATAPPAALAAADADVDDGASLREVDAALDGLAADLGR